MSRELLEFRTTQITSRVRNICGEKVGRLLVTSFAGVEKSTRKAYWHCLCDCGVHKAILASSLLAKTTLSCGCLRDDTFRKMLTKTGFSATPEARSWRSMLDRCQNPALRQYKHYGERGIKVCDRWQDLGSFLLDMGPRLPGQTLERIDNNGNYEPSNCRWASRTEQTRNRRVTLTWNGKPIAQWADELGAAYMTIYSRFKKHGSVFPQGEKA